MRPKRLTTESPIDGSTPQTSEPKVRISALLEAKRRYANAQRRARYWSGVPSFNPNLRSSECRTIELDLQYELAMCDCNSWEQTLKTLTGKRPGHYDPKRAFRNSFSKLTMKASNAELNDRRKQSEV